MLERRSALVGVYTPGQFGFLDMSAENAGGISFQLQRDSRITVLGAWPDKMIAACQWLSECADLPVGDNGSGPELGPGPEPGDAPGCEFGQLLTPGAMVKSSTARVLHVEPTKWWILDKVVSARSLDTQTGTLVDQSHGYVCLKITGPKAARLLNHHLSLDLRASKTACSWVATTVMHHTGVTLLCEGLNTYTLYLPRGFSVSLYELLVESALQFGLTVLPDSSNQ